MKVITRGNYFNKVLNLTEDTELRDGNFCLCKVITNGHNLILSGGNLRGLYIDGVKQDSFVVRRRTAHPTVFEMLGQAKARGGDDGVEAIKEGFARTILEGSPTMTFAQFQTAYENWRLANNNFVSFDMLFAFVQQFVPTGWTWAQVRDFVRTLSQNTWNGEHTEIVEELS